MLLPLSPVDHEDEKEFEFLILVVSVAYSRSRNVVSTAFFISEAWESVMAVMRRLAADIVRLEEEDEAFVAGFISRIEGITIQVGENTLADLFPANCRVFPAQSIL